MLFKLGRLLGDESLSGCLGRPCLSLDTRSVLLCFGDHRLCRGLGLGLQRCTLGEGLCEHLLSFGFEPCSVLFRGFANLGAPLVEPGQNRLHPLFRVRDQFPGIPLCGRDLAGRLEAILVCLVPRSGSGLLDRSC